MSFKVLVGSNCRMLGGELAESRGATRVEVKNFPDRELYVRIPEDVNGQDVLYVQSFYPNQNESLMEAFLTVDALSDLGAKSIELFAPYFPYARQDRRCREGEAVSALAVTRMFKNLGVRSITSVNAHQFKKEGVYDVSDLEFRNVNATSLITDFVKSNYGRDFVVALPDAGSRNLIDSDDVINFDKKRADIFSGKTGISSSREYDLKGKLVLLLDDIVSSGGTMAETYRKLAGMGAKEIIVACVHGLFVGECMGKFKACGVGNVVSTNTTDNQFSKVSILPILESTMSGGN